MKIRELFAANVTRDIPPVVYFHEQSPEKLKAEVDEYIITGGYPEGDPRARRFDVGQGGAGIHEQFVRLLKAIKTELEKTGGPELPSCWISGFYGSGKSSFAKLLGLALDQAQLPDGTPLIRALHRRDDSPLRKEFIDAWIDLTKDHPTMAVVFDIGGVARDDEHIHCAVLRQVQARLGYCRKSNLVAEFELRLQKDGEWERFLHVAKATLGKDWDIAKTEEQVEDHFSHVLHKLRPERYTDPMSWIDSRAGSRTGAGTSVEEVVSAVADMLKRNAADKHLFVVIDEVSQYVIDDDDRMVKLQSFVSALGQQLKGKVWLMATGQQKLDEKDGAGNLSKLKDRFRPSLRVHLGTTNIRDVVHKRLLKKQPSQEPVLRELFAKHRGDLKLYGYGCDNITEDDFVEVYPMLPGHVDLLMQITSNLRSRSTRTQGDDHAIRGLLQLLGELFRAQKLADLEVGALVTIDAIFDVQHSALDADVQATLSRILSHPEVVGDALAVRAAKAVALLELLQEQGTATTPELVSSCLYAQLGQGSQVAAIKAALEKLRNLNLLSYSEKGGFKVQSSAGQDWEQERGNLYFGFEVISEVVQASLKEMVGDLQENPRHKGRRFPWTLLYSDGRQARDLRLADTRDDSTVTIDFRLAKGERQSSTWIPRSSEETLRNRVLWVAGPGDFEDVAREFLRSQKMVNSYRDRLSSLPTAKRSLVAEEETRIEELGRKVKGAVAAAFLRGGLYFRGQEIRPTDMGSAFGSALLAVANRLLPDLYPHAAELPAVTSTEILQLLEPELHGPSPKFLAGALGILSLDGGKYVPECKGEHPRRILDEIKKTGGLSGQSLIAAFVGPPYGYPADLVRACVAGLLRGKRLRVHMEDGSDIGSYRDAGVRDLFDKDRPFRKAEFFPASEGMDPRTLIAIRKFFEKNFNPSQSQEEEALADAAFKYFPPARNELRNLERCYEMLPGRPALPEKLRKLGKALEDCCRVRPVDKIVEELGRCLNALTDGMPELGVQKAELSNEAVASVVQAAGVRDFQLAQLGDAGELAGLADDGERIKAQLAGPTPWRGIHLIEGELERVRSRYVEVRKRLLSHQTLAAEQAQARIKALPGFGSLDPEEAHRVLAPILAARVDTTPDAVSPTLAGARDTFASKIGPAEDQARDLLDEERNRVAPQKVVKVEANLRGREIGSREQLRAVFEELEERIGPLLDKGNRVRIG